MKYRDLSPADANNEGVRDHVGNAAQMVSAALDMIAARMSGVDYGSLFSDIQRRLNTALEMLDSDMFYHTYDVQPGRDAVGNALWSDATDAARTRLLRG